MEDVRRLFIVIILFSISVFQLSGQEIAFITRENGYFREVYGVDANDTTLRKGRYFHYYKGRIIEKGRYLNNCQIGKWQYFNLNNILEYEYDYDVEKIVRIAGRARRELAMATPCMFKGSPLIPYLFIVGHLNYPEQAKELDISGEVELGLRISKEGSIVSYYLSKKLHPILDHAVMKVAGKIPSEWEFLAATRMGNPINGEYRIAIQFELETK